MIEDGEGNLLMKDSPQQRKIFGNMPASNPDLHCQIVSCIKNGNCTMDGEEIAGVTDTPAPVHRVVIYRAEGDKIIHVRKL